MKNYEIKLSEKVTQIVQEFLGKGYIFRNQDASHGFDIKVELVNPSIPNEFVRIWVRPVYRYFDNKEDKEIVQNLTNNVLKVGIFNQNSSFEEDTLLLHKVYYTDPNNENIFIEDTNEAKRISDLRTKRMTRDYSSYYKTFKPTRKLRIPGFKTLDPQFVSITRRIRKNGLGKNEYIIKNMKNGKTRVVSY